MNEQKNNGRGIFYGVIGVATLVVAIIGATFAYFTATASNNAITGNMATVSLGLAVEKVTTADVDKGGMIPMSNSMVEAALVDNNGKGVCVDDNGNAVCQIYKITLTNNSSAGQFVDGYVALRGGSGAPTDLPKAISGDTDGDGVCDTNGDDDRTADTTETDFTEADCKNYTYKPKAMVDVSQTTQTYGTTMRWAQVFATNTLSGDTNTNGKCDADETDCKITATSYSTGGTQYLLDNDNVAQAIDDIDAPSANDTFGFNANNILTSGMTGTNQIAGNNYVTIVKNYIRISDHEWAGQGNKESYNRDNDLTSALVFNHSLTAGTETDYYFVVWLTETGTNQTPGASVGEGSDAITNPGAASFFAGNVTFTSAQGSEVSATFTGYAKVESDQA